MLSALYQTDHVTISIPNNNFKNEVRYAPSYYVHLLAKRYSFLFLNNVSHGEIKAHLKSITRYYVIEIIDRIDNLIVLLSRGSLPYF